MILRSPAPTLFPYTTLFRSDHRSDDRGVGEDAGDEQRARLRLRRACITERKKRCEQHAHDRRTFHGCPRSEEHTSELQSQSNLVCRLLLEKKKRPAEDSHMA